LRFEFGGCPQISRSQEADRANEVGAYVSAAAADNW
jgi:hypothetical protein